MHKTHFTYVTFIPKQRDEVWSFFSQPANLTKITTFPKVTILSESHEEIRLELSFFLFSVQWHVKMMEIERPDYFIDQGLKLPYPFKSWMHTHRFVSAKGGTYMIDDVRCESRLPSFFVKVLLTNLFNKRKKKLLDYFLQ